MVGVPVMPKLSARVAVLESELSEIRLLLERQTGVLLDAPAAKLAAAVSSYLEQQQMPTAAELLEQLRSSDCDCDSLVEHLLDGETGFFRNPKAFESLAKVVLPEMQSRKADTPLNLRIWSAGCSTGEEAYSIAMSLCETLNGNASWNVHIVGSDIRRDALETAERGLYPQSELENLPRSMVQKYFARVGEHYLAKPRVRNLVTFASTNLARPHYIGRFDCIFCMNVLSQFSAAQRASLVHSLHLYLQPGGYLFLGQGEKLPAMDVSFHARVGSEYTVYQKPMAAAARLGG
jgi:chemotaxis methyl-accepting protein methylase